MIFKFKKQYKALFAFIMLGCSHARVSLQLGFSGAYGLLYQQVKLQGLLASKNNKVNNNSTLAKFAQWDGNATHNQIAYRRQKTTSNNNHYLSTEQSKDLWSLAFIVIRELARQNVPGTEGMEGPSPVPGPLTGREVLAQKINLAGLMNVGIQLPTLRCEPFQQTALDGQTAAVQAFFLDPGLNPSTQVTTINGIVQNARFTPEVKKQMAQKALEVAEKIAGKGRFTLNASKDGLMYTAPVAGSPNAAELSALDVAAAFTARDFIECYDTGYQGMNLGAALPTGAFDQAMRDEYVKTLIALSNENNLNEAGLLCEYFDGQYDVQTKGFLGAMDFAGHINAIYEMNDSIGLGVGITLGYSCRDMDLKNTPVNIKEGLFIQIGVVVAFNDWIQFHCGLGGAKRTIGLNQYEGWSADYETAKKIVANPALTSMLDVKRSNQGLDPDDTLDHIALYAYAGVNLLFPVGDGVRLFVGISGQTDLNKCTGELGGAGDVEVGGMTYGKVSVGIMFEL